jgi:DNA-binding Lrp family transcriptional regulator
MTLQEVCSQLNLSESTVKSQFARTQKRLLDDNIKLIKNGRGASATYEIEYLTDNRALTIFDEVKDDIILSNESICLPSWEFLVFLAIVTTPMIVFRGSYKDFLNYVQLKPSEANLRDLKDALKTLSDSDVISYVIDKTNEEYFIAGIYRKVEEEAKIGIEMVKECKRLQEINNMKSFIPLIKVWIGTQVLIDKQPYTMNDICRITGLPMSTVRNANRILEGSNIYKRTPAYLNYQQRIGSYVELNGFYN